MDCLVIDGKKLAEKFNHETSSIVDKLKRDFGISPNFSLVIVGSDKNSLRLVTRKQKLAESLGIKTSLYQLSEDIKENELKDRLVEYQEKSDCLLLQLPLPGLINDRSVIEFINPLKDVDGIHPNNFIDLFEFQGKERLRLYPPTALAVFELIKDTRMKLGLSGELIGNHIVVCGRSKLVGLPIALILQREGATVSICHSQTPNDLRQDLLSKADIVVSAVGKIGLIKASDVKLGSIIIDVANNFSSDGKVTGDVHFECAISKVSAISPVPGGVGPMTMAMLMRNILISISIQRNLGHFS